MFLTKNSAELLARLTTQFAEQATNTEAEEKALLAKNFPPEDVQYYSRKSACLWLCSMACFAANKWDYVYLLDNLLVPFPLPTKTSKFQRLSYRQAYH